MNGLIILISLMTGLVLSGLYFGGLWLTVQRLPEAPRPKTLLVGSFLARTALVLVGFYLLIVSTPPSWEGLVAALGGFLIGRGLLIRRWKPIATSSNPSPIPHGN